MPETAERLSFLSSRRIPPPKEKQLQSFFPPPQLNRVRKRQHQSPPKQNSPDQRSPIPLCQSKQIAKQRKTIAIRIVQKNTGIPPLLLLHQEVTEVQMLQFPLPVKAVRGTLNPHRPLHLQKRTANQK